MRKKGGGDTDTTMFPPTDGPTILIVEEEEPVVVRDDSSIDEAATSVERQKPGCPKRKSKRPSHLQDYLVGYCAERSKHALIFYFMPNGSLDMYIFNREKALSLDWDTKFKIAVQVARGIEYLHSGCDIQILHFDIKPHNILLDDKFVPKILNFGLAKLCATNKEAETLTAAKGTIGYIAPELINRSIGAVSYKADVYSFGMLLMEMVGLNKDLTQNNDESSKYFPLWIYDHLSKDRDIDIGNVDENDDRNISRKMTIVALWCIQMIPGNRPSMNKVLEMLEGDVEHMQVMSNICRNLKYQLINGCDTMITENPDKVTTEEISHETSREEEEEELDEEEESAKEDLEEEAIVEQKEELRRPTRKGQSRSSHHIDLSPLRAARHLVRGDPRHLIAACVGIRQVADWVWNYCSNHEFASWYEFLEDVRHLFDPTCYQSFFGRLTKLTQTGRVLEYQSAFESL
ncbi:PR5-like receptor kinase [Salvia hispanica]|uniref:PR5-like receptor kinase n=1 Tax=Salvia hispanica TaxID=49212 RepID=UPI00200937DF|nr:PR5-like receptor kinase [Salvia hispanica]